MSVLLVALGPGVGADQFMPTTSAPAFILTSIGALRWSQSGGASKNLYLSIGCPVPDGEVSPIPEFETVLRERVSSSDLRRIDKRDGTLAATDWVGLENPGSVTDMTDELEHAFPAIGIKLIDEQRVLAI